MEACKCLYMWVARQDPKDAGGVLEGLRQVAATLQAAEFLKQHGHLLAPDQAAQQQQQQQQQQPAPAEILEQLAQAQQVRWVTFWFPCGARYIAWQLNGTTWRWLWTRP